MSSAANDRKYIFEAETGDGILCGQLGLAFGENAHTRITLFCQEGFEWLQNKNGKL